MRQLPAWLESKQEYNRLISEWLASGRAGSPVGRSDNKGLVISKLILAYWNFAEGNNRNLVQAVFPPLRYRKRVLHSLVEHYSMRHAADPGQGFGAQAAQWSHRQRELGQVP